MFLNLHFNIDIIMHSFLFYLIIVFIVFEFCFNRLLEVLNNKGWERELPEGLKNLYDKEKYTKAKSYDQEKDTIGLISSLLSTCLIILFLLMGGFAILDEYLRHFIQNEILLSLLYFGILGLASTLISLPFSLYNTFVIEEKYGFNKTTPKIFVFDMIKSLLLSVIIGGLILSIIIFIQEKTGEWFWLLAWATISGFSLFFAAFYTSILLPFFNKLTPLEAGSLRTKIEAYATKVNFPLKNILLMDGSKRSSKANAFFSGIGGSKSIVLFDTLVNELSEEEIVAVLAHEVGHYKKKHIFQSMAVSFLTTAITLYIFGRMMNSDILPAILGTAKSFHISLIVFGMLYSPISLLTSPMMNFLSRKNEYEADAYAKETYGSTALSSSLKKMSINHLSNLQPHPWYLFFHYSHPTLLQRLKAMNEL